MRVGLSNEPSKREQPGAGLAAWTLGLLLTRHPEATLPLFSMATHFCHNVRRLGTAVLEPSPRWRIAGL